MPTPKKRHSKQRGRKRRTHWKLEVPSLAVCPQCKTLKRPHQICQVCGFYKDRVVVEIKTKKEKKKE